MSAKLTFCRTPGPGETRLCTDPWSFVYVRANGNVELCCRGEVVGNLGERSLEAILAGPESTRVRRGLLTGELVPGCKTCPRCSVVPLAELRRAVEHELFEAGVDELEALRRQVREHRVVRAELLAEREHLRGHVANLEAERPHLVAHAANLEAERARLLARVATLEREHLVSAVSPRAPRSLREGLRRWFASGGPKLK